MGSLEESPAKERTSADKDKEMTWHAIKRNRADILFSDYIREKAGWRCEKCKKLCRIDGTWIASLQASHYWVRNHWNTRYDERNVHSLCGGCHKRMGEYRRDENGEYDSWMKELLGETGYKKLKLDANTTAHRDPKMWLLYVKQVIKQGSDQR